ncbi:MAG: hypothetical protein KME38_28815 [Spirirestis rafaelensis WJT71-NPBG6]|jgi:hypothetical protein|nr:hypothetical protein [Spirirestis rafaelensis WJT71-NPBG6]
MNRQEMILRTAKGEVAHAAQVFIDKVEQLRKIEDLTYLNTAVYDSTDLCIEDAQNVLHFLIKQIEGTTNV